MNTKRRLKNLRNIAPDYQRIPHLSKSISQMTHDDIEVEEKIVFPLECWVQEKVDGANMGVSWTSGPVLRNRNNILKKGYIEKETPAKLQFRPAWNWIHDNREDIMKIQDICKSQITIYGEWLYAKHSIEYNKLPDYFIAYDIYICEEDKFLSPVEFEKVISQTNINYIKSKKIVFNNIFDVVNESERTSLYRDGVVEGIVLKTEIGPYLQNTFKVVNKYFKRTDDFNTVLIKNKIK